MDSLRIDTGVKRIAINDDPNNVIEFNPSDVTFAERFYGLIKEFEDKLAEFKTRSEAIDANTEVDINEIPVNLQDRLILMREACTFIRVKIDSLFGEGTSQKVFGDTLNLDCFTQFFEGITPFIQTARSEKLAKYNNKLSGRVMK
jgi:hypothetical protein